MNLIVANMMAQLARLYADGKNLSRLQATLYDRNGKRMGVTYNPYLLAENLLQGRRTLELFASDWTAGSVAVVGDSDELYLESISLEAY